MGLTPDQALTALRTASPAEEQLAPARQRGQPRRGRQLAIGALIVIVLGFAGFLSWSYYLSPVTVLIAPAQLGVRLQVYGLGTVGARIQSNAGFKVSGVLVALKADQGDRVQAGQELAQLDARDVEAQFALAKAGVGQARANIEKAKANVASADANLINAKAVAARRAALVKNGFATIEETQTTDAAARVAAANLVSAQSGLTVAEAALRSTQAQEAFAQATLSYYTLYAPYDAWVVSRNLELGSIPNPGQSVFTLVAAHTVWVLGYVDERLAGQLQAGQPAEIILRSNPAAHIAGHVERVEIQSDPVNEERLVDVAFDKVPGNIHLAEQAEVVITTAVLPRAVLVPPAAITNLQNGHGMVWTVEDGRLARHEVTFGPELLDGRLPILEGLPAGAEVVTAPVAGMRAGRAALIEEAISQ